MSSDDKNKKPSKAQIKEKKGVLKKDTTWPSDGDSKLKSLTSNYGMASVLSNVSRNNKRLGRETIRNTPRPYAPGEEVAAKMATQQGTAQVKNIINNALVMLDAIEAQKISLDMAGEQMSSLENENSVLLKGSDTSSQSINLNNRKTFYEEQQLNVVNNIYYIIYIIYWIIYATLILIVLFTRSYRRFNRYKMLGILVSLTVFPFVIIYFANIVYTLMTIISTIISKNVYIKL